MQHETKWNKFDTVAIRLAVVFVSCIGSFYTLHIGNTVDKCRQCAHTQTPWKRERDKSVANVTASPAPLLSINLMNAITIENYIRMCIFKQQKSVQFIPNIAKSKMVQLDSYSADETREKRHKPVKSNRTECIRLHWFQSFEFMGQLLFDNSRLCYLRYGHGRRWRQRRWFLFCCHIWPLLWIYHRNIPMPFSFLFFSSICLYINVWTRISNYSIVDMLDALLSYAVAKIQW